MSEEEKIIEDIKEIISKCKECKFATCEQCEINWTQIKAIQRFIRLIPKSYTTYRLGGTKEMELEIEDNLNKAYRNIIIEVCFVDFRKYNIHIFDRLPDGISASFNYSYDAYLTFDANIGRMKYMIDRLILDYYKKEVVYK